MQWQLTASQQCAALACVHCVCVCGVCVCVVAVVCWSEMTESEWLQIHMQFGDKKHLSTHDTLKKIKKLKTQPNDGIGQTLDPKSTVFRSVSLVSHYGAFFEKSVSDTAATLFCFSSKK